MVFEQFNDKVREAIEKRGWDSPTPVQEKASPSIMAGENTLVMAPTGLGKTESAMLPIFSMWSDERHEPISILYITPLRALNRDLFQRLKWWAKQLDMEITVRHGDTTQYERQKQADFPSHMFITTPETLQAMVTAPKLREALDNVKWVVVDEIHELVDNKRGSQLSTGLARLRELSEDFQVVGLSATIGSPEDVADFLSPDTEVVDAMSAKELDIQVVSPTPTSEDKQNAQELFTGPDVAARLRTIEDAVSDHEKSLVFTNTRASAEILSSRLSTVEKGWDHDIHHSSLSKEVRVEAEDGFKEDDIKALICTSSLELGIDIGDIELVVQYMSPRRVSKLVQRVGRSGHNVGEVSKGLVVAGDADDIMESSVIARRALEGKLEPTEIYPTPVDVLAGQIVGMAIEEYDRTDDEIYDRLTEAFPYRDMDRETFDEILDYMTELGMVWNDRPAEDGEGFKVHRRRKAWKYYYNNLSTIPDTFQYDVVNNLDNSNVGVLDEAFVAEHGEPGTSFIVKGSPWQILSVHEGKVHVEPAGDIGSAIPAWEGELMPVPYEVAQEVGYLRRKTAELLEEEDKETVVDELTDEYPMSEEAAMKVVEYIEGQVEEGSLPTDEHMVLEADDDFVVLHTCFGTKVNEVMSRFFAVLLSSERGHSVAIRNDPYRIVFKGISREAVEEVLMDNDGEDLYEVVHKTIDRTQAFRWRMVHVAKRFGALKRRAQWDKLNMKRLTSSFEGTPVFREAKNEVFFEKMDVEEARELFQEMKHEDTPLEREDGLSPIGNEAVEYQFKELVGPERPDKEIFEVFKERLLGTKKRLICVKCGDYTVTKTVGRLDDDIGCPACGSGMVSLLAPHDKEGEKIIKKNAEGKELDEEEEERMEKLEDIADLVLTYGRDAALCLAGRGVGPETTIRVLAKQKETEDEMLKAILDAERQYAKTKKFWN